MGTCLNCHPTLVVSRIQTLLASVAGTLDTWGGPSTVAVVCSFNEILRLARGSK